MFSLSALLAGCTSLEPEQKDALRDAAHAYASITTEMTEAHVLHVLGLPKEKSEGVAKWEVVAAPRNFESLEVEFSDTGQVRRIERKSNRFGSAPLFKAERTIIRRK